MEPELVWRLLVGQLFFFMISLASVFRSGGGEAKGDVDLGGEPLWILVPLRIAGLLLWGSVLAYIFAGDMIVWGRWSLPFVVRVAGLLLALASLPLVMWMFKHIGLNLTVTVKTRREHDLIKTGPYRWIRHPLYTFAGATFLGIALASACWLTLVGWVAGGIFLVLRLPLEEQGLIERFGDEYRDYIKETGAFFPKLG